MDNTEMTGAELFELYTSTNNSYGQILNIAFLQIGFDLYPMLEEAESTGKKIELKDIEGYNRNFGDKPFKVVLKSLRKKRALKYLSYYAPCLMCKYLESGCKCEAFPKGIPNIILEGNHDHCQPMETQSNYIVFQRIGESLT